MKKPFSDQDVLNLLTNLKSAESSYPSEMIESRRDVYMKQAAAMAVLAGAGGNGASAAGNAQMSAASSASTSTASGGLTISGLLETALVVAIVVEAGIVTYIYRDRISDFIKSTLSPRVEQTANPPDGSLIGVPAVASETATAPAEETVTVTVTSMETPTPPDLSAPAGDNNSNSDSEVQATTTPNPNDNSGLHLGQTKQPTKDSSPNGQNDNKKDKNK